MRLPTLVSGRSTLQFLLLFLPWPLVAGPVSPSARAEEMLFDSAMYQSPALPTPKIVVTHVGEKEVWLKALARPEAEYKCKAAATISEAHRVGVQGMADTAGALLDEINRKEAPPVVRLCLANTLISLNAKQAAQSLFTLSKTEAAEFRELVEPALAEWRFPPAREDWLARLKNASAHPKDLVLAVRCLGILREPTAITPLRKLLASTDFVLLNETAHALGQIAEEGLEEDAQTLLRNVAPQRIPYRLAGIALLRKHRSNTSAKLLLEALSDSESAVVAMAADVLFHRDEKLLLPSIESLCRHSDSKVRTIAVRTLHKNPSLPGVEHLLARFEDDHAGVRAEARRTLVAHAKSAEYRKSVVNGAIAKLKSEKWGALEQSILLLTLLDEKSAAMGFIPHLSHPRNEVFVSAAWGLRKLSVPETLPGCKQFVEMRLGLITQSKDLSPNALWIDYQISQVNQLIGDQQYREADSTLRRFLQKPPADWGESRAAAIWALGKIHQGKVNKTLADSCLVLLEQDTTKIPPEDERVRRMCAITLARMGALQGEDMLRKYYEARKPTFGQVNNACGWALEVLKGEKVPAPEVIHQSRRNWFIRAYE